MRGYARDKKPSPSQRNKRILKRVTPKDRRATGAPHLFSLGPRDGSQSLEARAIPAGCRARSTSVSINLQANLRRSACRKSQPPSVNRGCRFGCSVVRQVHSQAQIISGQDHVYIIFRRRNFCRHRTVRAFKPLCRFDHFFNGSLFSFHSRIEELKPGGGARYTICRSHPDLYPDYLTFGTPAPAP